MHIRCPHCHNPIEIIDTDILSDISCPDCGSNFNLVEDETVFHERKTSSSAPRRIKSVGHFELQEPLGTGQFGTVWKAHDTKLDRIVAVKIPRRGQLESNEAEMFIREARSAAQVKHPGVVSVHEVGREGDTLYIVSDFIEGGSLKEELSRRQLTPREAAELCIKVADALNAAHEAGIVHRDLKPGNIMMDETGEPHVTDFGLAKRETGEITMTIDGLIMGTPAYMSPEQARGEAHKADRRSDVYSLGVILFELLTGEIPFRGAQHMMLVQILEDQPPSPRKLQSRVPRDLETICLKCMEKDPAKRYPTSGEVADELRRYLRGEPIAARRIGRVAHAWRWCKRNPVVANLIGLVAAALIAGTIVSSAFAVVANKQRNRAEEGEKLANQRLIQVEAEKQKTEEERRIALTVRDFLQTKLLGQADVREQANSLLRIGGSSATAKLNPTIRELLDRAAEELAPERIESNFPKQPLLQAEILETVGNAYGGVGDYERSTEFMKRATTLFQAERGPDHPDTLVSMSNLANVYLSAGNLDLALPLHEKTLKLRKLKLGPDHPDTLTSMNNLANAYKAAGKLDLALSLHEETLKRRKAKLGPDHPDTLCSMNNLADVCHAAGKLDLSLPLFEEAMKLRTAKLGPDHPDTLLSMNNLATAYDDAGKLDLSLPLHEEALRLTKVKLGADHLDTLSSTASLAAAYQDAGDLDRALPLFEETLKLMKVKLGPDHPATLMSMNNLAYAYTAADKLDLALPIYEESLKLAKEKLGPDHPATLSCMNNLATTYDDMGKLDLALPLYEETLRLRKMKLGPDHPDTLTSMNNLACAYNASGKPDLAVTLHEVTLKRRTAKLGPDHPATLTSMNNLAAAYSDAGKRDLALPLYKETLKLRTAKLGPDHADTLSSMDSLANVYSSAGQLDLSLPLFEEAMKLRTAKLGSDHPDTLCSMNGLANTYYVAGKLDLALPLHEETLRLRTAKLGRDHPDTLTSMFNLAKVYHDTKSLDKSTSLLEELLRLQDNKLGRQHLDTLLTVAELGLNQKDAGHIDEALPLLEEAVRATREFPSLCWVREHLFIAYIQVEKKHEAKTISNEILADARRQLPEQSPRLAAKILEIASPLLKAKAYHESEALLRECLTILEKTRPDSWTTYHTTSMLGGALLGQEKYAEAEPLLLAGYEGMKQREAKIPPAAKVLMVEAIERLIELAKVQGKKQEEAKWQAEFDARKKSPQ